MKRTPDPSCRGPVPEKKKKNRRPGGKGNHAAPHLFLKGKKEKKRKETRPLRGPFSASVPRGKGLGRKGPGHRSVSVEKKVEKKRGGGGERSAVL